MCDKYKNKRCLFLVLIIIMINLLYIYIYIVDFDGKRSFFFCDNSMDENVVSFRDKWKAIDVEESAYVFSAYMIPEDFRTDLFSKFM